MNNNKLATYILIAVGVVVVLISLGADVIGLGADPANFGWKQILGAGAGAVLVIAGIFLLRGSKSPKSQPGLTQDQGQEKPDDLA